MKEYICKEDIIQDIEKHNYSAQKLWIDGFATVTKADICREFAEKVKEKFKNDYTTTAVEIGIAINEVLAKMEKEECSQ